MSEFVKESILSEEMIKTSDIAEALQFVLRLSPSCVVPEIASSAPARRCRQHCKESNMDPDNLRAVPLFAEMADRDLRVIATFATEDSVPAGATLMREGDYSNEVLAIETGTADVLHRATDGGQPGSG